MTEGHLDQSVRALSSGVRRRILQLCTNRFVTAGDIVRAVNLAPASVSEHLKVLRKLRLVDLERTGTMWLYRTNRDQLRTVLTELSEAVQLEPIERS